MRGWSSMTMLSVPGLRSGGGTFVSVSAAIGTPVTTAESPAEEAGEEGAAESAIDVSPGCGSDGPGGRTNPPCANVVPGTIPISRPAGRERNRGRAGARKKFMKRLSTIILVGGCHRKRSVYHHIVICIIV